MKTGNEFDQVVYGYWAKRFDCNREDFTRSGSLVIKEEELAETGKIIIYQIDRMNVVRAAPLPAIQAGLPDGYDRDLGSLTVKDLQGMVPEEYQVELESTLLDCFLDPRDFKSFTAGEDLTIRQLDAEKDSSDLMSLYEACTEEDLDYADIDIEEPDHVIYGIFAKGQLVAYASHRYWDDVFADMGVLVHPHYRGRGLGKVVVSALCEWCIENEVVPMYRVFSNLVHSRRLSQALGFKEMVIIQTLKVAKVGTPI